MHTILVGNFIQEHKNPVPFTGLIFHEGENNRHYLNDVVGSYSVRGAEEGPSILSSTEAGGILRVMAADRQVLPLQATADIFRHQRMGEVVLVESATPEELARFAGKEAVDGLIRNIEAVRSRNTYR